MADQFMFFALACQYYVSARFAVHAECMPVAGNLFHHAVEMFLKAGLAPNRNLSELRDMSHDLKKLWRSFKQIFPNDALTQHDNTISALQKFESIRYPDDQNGIIEIATSWHRPHSVTNRPGSARTKPSRKFVLIVSDIDDLIINMCKECSQNPGEFISNVPAYEAVMRRNKHSKFLKKSSLSPTKPRPLLDQARDGGAAPMGSDP